MSFHFLCNGLILSANCTISYVNFAHGDEPLENIYGENLPKLQALKNKYDPQNRFNQWFDITGDKLIAL